MILKLKGKYISAFHRFYNSVSLVDDIKDARVFINQKWVEEIQDLFPEVEIVKA